MTRNDHSTLDILQENELPSNQSNDFKANNPTTPDSGEAKIDLENRNNEIPLADPVFNPVVNPLDDPVVNPVVDQLADPNPNRVFMSYFRLPQVQNFIAPVLNQIIADVRENPGYAAFNALAIGTSVLWGVQLGFPYDYESHMGINNDFVNVFANSLAFSGVIMSGAIFSNEVRRALSGDNPLGRRMLQLGAIAWGVYLQNENESVVGIGDEALSILGASMSGITLAACLDDFANMARPLVRSGATQFAELVSNSLGLPSNNVQAVQAVQAVQVVQGQGLNQQQNGIEGNNRI